MVGREAPPVPGSVGQRVGVNERPAPGVSWHHSGSWCSGLAVPNNEDTVLAAAEGLL